MCALLKLLSLKFYGASVALSRLLKIEQVPSRRVPYWSSMAVHNGMACASPRTS